jgi:CheY-like chemotaxis protein
MAARGLKQAIRQVTFAGIAAAPGHRVRILYVEDQRVFADIVATQFLASHEVVIAESVAAARAVFASDPAFDAVLVDYDLPDGKGAEVIRHLRGAGFGGVLVAVSGKDDGNAELRAAGAHEVCKKSGLSGIGAVLERLAAGRTR